MILNSKGQTHILVAAVMSFIILGAGLRTFQVVENSNLFQFESTRRTGMRIALDLAIQKAYQLYQSSGCDVVLLNRKLDRIQVNGSLGTTTGNRYIDLTSNNVTYSVSFGPVVRYAWNTPANQPAAVTNYSPGFSQDALIEVWTSNGRQRMIQRAALINNCNYPCSYVGADASSCQSALDAAVSYHRLQNLASFPTADHSIGLCFGGRRMGDLNLSGSATCSAPGIGDSQVDVTDLELLRNYLRTGESTGTCLSILQGNSLTAGCADLNGDQLVNEIDLGLLEKLLRGYINTIPVTRPLPATP